MNQINDLERENAELRAEVTAQQTIIQKLATDRDERQAKIERLRYQLVCCSEAARGNSTLDQAGWTPEYQDVVELRRKYEELLHALKKFEYKEVKP